MERKGRKGKERCPSLVYFFLRFLLLFVLHAKNLSKSCSPEAKKTPNLRTKL